MLDCDEVPQAFECVAHGQASLSRRGNGVRGLRTLKDGGAALEAKAQGRFGASLSPFLECAQEKASKGRRSRVPEELDFEDFVQLADLRRRHRCAE